VLHPYFEPSVLEAVRTLAQQHEFARLEAEAHEIMAAGQGFNQESPCEVCDYCIAERARHAEADVEEPVDVDRVSFNAAGLASMLQMIRDEQIALREQVERLANILGERP